MRAITLNEYIAQTRPLLEKHLIDYLAQKNATVRRNDIYFKDALTKLNGFITKGKLLRGILAVLIYELFGGKVDEKILNIASAIELTQSALVIHDDIMDKDLVRRGMKTIYGQYIDEAIDQPIKDCNFYGQSMGMCVGDIVFFLAFELLADSSAELSIQSKIIALFAKEFQRVNSAQMHDFTLGQVPKDPGYDEIIDVYTYKTGRYTYSLPMQLGAVAASVSEQVSKTLDIIGENLGVAFQITDDELGIFADEKILGKPIGSDIRENKKTLIRHLLYEKSTADEKRLLDFCFGSNDITLENIEQIKALIHKYSIQKIIEEKRKMFTDKALQLVHKLNLDGTQKALLTEIVEYNSKRIK